MNTTGRIGSYPIGSSCPLQTVAPSQMTPIARTLEAARTRPHIRAMLAADAARTTPEPTPPAPQRATIAVAGHTLYAPGFTADSFDRAIQRAHDEGLTVDATDRRDMVLVSNPAHGTAYTVSRSECSCKAGQRGVPCKHRALCIFLADVMHQLPQPAIPAIAAAA